MCELYNYIESVNKAIGIGIESVNFSTIDKESIENETYSGDCGQEAQTERRCDQHL